MAMYNPLSRYCVLAKASAREQRESDESADSSETPRPATSRPRNARAAQARESLAVSKYTCVRYL